MTSTKKTKQSSIMSFFGSTTPKGKPTDEIKKNQKEEKDDDKFIQTEASSPIPQRNEEDGDMTIQSTSNTIKPENNSIEQNLNTTNDNTQDQKAKDLEKIILSHQKIELKEKNIVRSVVNVKDYERKILYLSTKYYDTDDDDEITDMEDYIF
ncbi:hypothetical protein TVAG_288040 [Trichomonas vaginalis G3]|uniref:Uncharacterized protein n=1 Tax=Trichomonas vaginalis (strain ATCC PRA-98 / G3) TaxID=412133 RepID=A2G5D3_TRIV3|nr:hypothetical protein TVAGG3_0807370 [Trichomonas vaginalis G3]EAX87630.1 hypothetical protein TVAG_288040 [Trichomonas vaginalis G3]KAI5496956.1 hypothetical protein TVAGG3_0807370 [Trichomonas vaginalis G3]|eukprot:XP_001300560.1 hypothetical protein [Trichomonas vaginalis G3]